MRVGRAVDVGGLEVRAAGVRVAGALHQRQSSLVEDASQAVEPRMQADSACPAASVPTCST